MHRKNNLRNLRKDSISEVLLGNRRIEIHRGLVISYGKRRKSHLGFFGKVFILILIFFAFYGFSWLQKNNFVTNLKSRVAAFSKIDKYQEGEYSKIDRHNFFDLGASEGEYVKPKILLIAAENNNRITVYRQNIESSDKELIFEFDKKQKISELDNDEVSRSIALSPNKNKIAYISNNGLNVYDLISKESKLLIKLNENEGEKKISATDQTNEREKDQDFSLNGIDWSPDGKFLSMVQVFSEYQRLCLFELDGDGYLVPVQNSNGESLSGENMRWAPKNNLIVDSEAKLGNQAGLFISSMNDFKTLVDLSSEINQSKNEFYEAVISDDASKIAFVYDNKFAEKKSFILATADLKGGNKNILDQEDIKSTLFFSPGGKNVFFIARNEDRDVVLFMMNEEDKKRKEVGIMPKGFDYWYNPIWLGGKYLAIFGKAQKDSGINLDEKATFLMLDVLNKSVVIKKEIDQGMYMIDFF